MAKKAKKAKKSDSQQLSDGVHASAQQIWQAGLDAFAKTQNEGSKVISRMAKEGSSLQKRTRKIAEDKAAEVSDELLKMTHSMGKQASDSWDRLEQLIEQTVARTLTNFGLSTQKEILALHKRIDELSTVAPKKPAIKKAAAKTAIKKTVTTKTATPSAPTKKVAAKKAAKRPAAKTLK